MTDSSQHGLQAPHGGGLLQGSCAVVVGAGSSIGLASAVAFARNGAQVLAVDPDAAAAERVVAAAPHGAAPIEPLVAALDTTEGAQAVAEYCARRWNRLDALFTCQARLDYEPAGEATLAHWEDLIRTNLLGPIAYTQALMPLLERSGRGSLVYLCSIDGQFANPKFPGYSVSKGGLIPLTHAMADAGGARNVRVNAIAMAAMSPLGSSDPVPIDIEAADRLALVQATPLGRVAQPDEVANVAAFLCSELATYVSGAVIPVDGARTAITPGTGARATAPAVPPSVSVS